MPKAPAIDRQYGHRKSENSTTRIGASAGPLKGAPFRLKGSTGPCSYSRRGLLREVLVELLRVVEDLLQPARLLLRHAGLLLVALGVAPRGRRAGSTAARSTPSRDGARRGPRRGPRRQGRVEGQHRRDQRERAQPPSRDRHPPLAVPHARRQGGAGAAGGEEDHERQRVDRIGEQAQLAEGLDQDELDAEEHDAPRPGPGNSAGQRDPRRRGPGVRAARGGPARTAGRATARTRGRRRPRGRPRTVEYGLRATVSQPLWPPSPHTWLTAAAARGVAVVLHEENAGEPRR